jgi:hypothetical protein
MKHALLAAVALASAAVHLSATQPSAFDAVPADQTTDGSEFVNYTFLAHDEESNDIRGMNVLFGDQSECWLWYEFQGNTISIYNNGNWITGKANEPGPILHGNSCEIDPARVNAYRGYSTGHEDLYLQIRARVAGAPGIHNLYISATSNEGESSPYVKTGTWTITPEAPFTMTVTPQDAFIGADREATARVTIANNPGTVNLSLGAFPNGLELTGSIGETSITGDGAALLRIRSSGILPAGYRPVEIVARASDGSSERRYQFEIFVDDAAPRAGMLPLIQALPFGDTFNFLVRDDGTAREITGLNILISATLDGRNACWIWYDARTDYLWLADDDALTWRGVLLSSMDTVSNSQCTVGGPATPVTPAGGVGVHNDGSNGTDLNLQIPISFPNQSFGGTKNVYLRTANFSGFDSGYNSVRQYVVNTAPRT